MSVTIKKHAFIISLIVGVVALLWFVLVAHGAGSTFATGNGQDKLELTISSSVRYNSLPYPSTAWELKDLVPTTDHFFDFGDVKPGDEAQHSIGIRVEKNSAYVCLDFNNLTDFENGLSESESLVDATSNDGELSETVYFFAWRDDNSNNTFDIGEEPLFGSTPQSARSVLGNTTYALADVGTATSYPENSTHYIGITWCAGDIAVNIPTAEIHCDGEKLGNIIQTDSMNFDVSIRAVSTKGQPKFYCRPEERPFSPGQCPAGYQKIVDDYEGGLSWTADGAYSSVILVGGPTNENNKDPDGRNKYFYNVRMGETLAREAHDISHICAKTEGILPQSIPDVKSTVLDAVPTNPEWTPVTPSTATVLKSLGKGALKKLGL